MDLFTRLLIRAAVWVRRPPSTRMVATVLGAVALALLVVAIERYVGWPDWATADRLPRRPWGIR